MAIYTEELQKQAATVLRDAAAAIEQYGWVQGAFGQQDTGYCAVGAINLVTDNSNYNQRLNRCRMTKELFREWLVDHLDATDFFSPCNCPKCHKGIEAWNDNPGNSKEMVIQTMRKAADDLAPQIW